MNFAKKLERLPDLKTQEEIDHEAQSRWLRLYPSLSSFWKKLLKENKP